MSTEQAQDGHFLADLREVYHRYRAEFLAFAQAFPVAEADRIAAYRQALIAWYEAHLREGDDFSFDTQYYLQEAGTFFLAQGSGSAGAAAGTPALRDLIPARPELTDEQRAMRAQLSELGHTCRELLLLSYYHRLSDERIAEVLAIPEATLGVNRKRMQCVLMVNERLRNSGLVGRDNFVMDADEALLDRLARHAMTAAAERDLLARRQAEPRLSLAYRRWQRWLAALRAYGRAELDDLLRDEERQYATYDHATLPSGLVSWRGLVVAAGLLILIGVIAYGLAGPPPATVQVERYFSLYPNIIVTTDNPNEPPDEYLARAFRAYENGDYAFAYREFADLLPVYPEARLYLGICALGQEQYDRAIGWFGEIAPGERYYAASQWYLALALLGDDREAAARALLNEIVTTGGHPFLRQSRALLDELR
jgi:hypothetical protein